MNRMRCKKRISIAFVVLLFATITIPNANANHRENNGDINPPIDGAERVCEDALEDIDEERVDTYRSGISASFPAGIYVPVFDSAVNSSVQDVGDKLDDLGNEFDELQELVSRNELQNNRAQRYLRELCQKEYEEDHTLQHAWARLIGEFVGQTKIFIERGFAGNPAFITSQPAYYQLVAVTASRVFLQDIVNSDMGSETKRNIIESVSLDLYAYDFPYDAPVTPPGVPSLELSPDEMPDTLSREGGGNFYYNGGYDALGRLLFYERGGDEETTINEAMAALDSRILQQLDYEKEKLDWGRGFFSYEVCDLSFQNFNVEDRRNCRIATPGSLIQDQASFVFGSALRQMELNDEYEEWIAPNTLAVLSDILSYRGLNNLESRNTNIVMGSGQRQGDNVTEIPTGPSVTRTNSGYYTELSNVNLYSTLNDNPLVNGDQRYDPDGNGPIPPRSNVDGPLPYEFSSIIDVELFGAGGGTIGTVGIGGLGQEFFGNFLNPQCFLDRITDPNPPSCNP